MKESANPSQSKATGLGLKIAKLAYWRFVNWTLDFNPNAESVCEIGPGRGDVCEWAKMNNLRYTAIDQTYISVRMLYDKGMDEFFEARVPPLPEVKADIFVLFALLEHLDGPAEAGELIGSIKEALNPNGVIAVLVPDIRFDGRFFWENSMEHNYVTSLQRVTFLLEEYGFEIMRREMVCGPLRLPLGYLIAVPARILRWFYFLTFPKRYGTTLHKISIHTPLAYVIGKK